MRKILFFFLFCCLKLHAQYPSMADYVISSNATTTFEHPCREVFDFSTGCQVDQGRINTEIPPWIIPGGWRSYFFVSHASSYIWSSPKSLVDNSNINLRNDAVGAYTATIPNVSPYGDHWRRNYHAVYSAHYVNHATQGTISLGFCHSENKNVANGDCYDPNTHTLNSIQPNQTIDCSDIGTYSGPGKIDGWKAYNGIVNAVWTPNNSQTNWGQQYFTDLGPILWPANGYVTASGAKATEGFRHPSSIMHNDYLYIYVVDAGNFDPNIIPLEEGRRGGVKLIKVHKDQALNPANYNVYYKDPIGNEFWNPALPAGFTKENMLSFTAVKGSKSSDLFNDHRTNSSVVRFSVAKVKYTDYFIGVEQYFDNTDQFILDGKNASRLKVAVRYSNDLINWSERQVVYVANTWETSYLNYPIFLSRDGWSNTEVDGDDFYILGTGQSEEAIVYKKHIFKYIPPPPPPPPPPTGECPPNEPCPFIGGVSKKTSNSKEKEVLSTDAVTVMPNPVSSELTVKVGIHKPSKVLINLYNSEGKFVKQLSEETRTESFIKRYNVNHLASGIYYVEVVTPEQRTFKKVVKH